ncbi:hypothetical protein KAF44_20400 (plasmid) [Cupriavidus necator]|nr:hypothetical protein KAF44_20400 [Cupriavidus necator]
MLSQHFKSPSQVQLLLSRPGGPLLEGFSQYLEQLGYANSSICTRITAASHFLFWANREGMSLPFNELTLERFAEHLSRCQCKGFGHQRSIATLRGARMFLTHQGRIGTRATGFTALAAELESFQFLSFCQWMRQQRGICDATLYNHGIALRDLFRRGDDLGKLNARDLRQFILEQSMMKGWAASKHCTTALRMLVRYLTAEGKCAVGLEAAIPVLAHWSLSTLPRYLQLDEVERVIAACDTASPVGLRDRAILLLLARLGLRAGDIWHLRAPTHWGYRLETCVDLCLRKKRVADTLASDTGSRAGHCGVSPTGAASNRGRCGIRPRVCPVSSLYKSCCHFDHR